MPAMKAREGSSGVEGVLAFQIVPSRRSISVMSVKVPPMSMATAARASVLVMQKCNSRHGVAVFAAMEELGGRALDAEPLGLGTVERTATLAEPHAVVLAGGRNGDEAAQHIPLHTLGLAVEGMAVTAATPGFDADHISPAHQGPVGDRRQQPLAGAAGIDHHTSLAAVQPAGDAPGLRHRTVETVREQRVGAQPLDLANDAAAAAPAPGAAAIAMDRVDHEPHRMQLVHEFRGIVLLRDEIDGVVAIGIRSEEHTSELQSHVN